MDSSLIEEQLLADLVWVMFMLKMAAALIGVCFVLHGLDWLSKRRNEKG